MPLHHEFDACEISRISNNYESESIQLPARGVLDW